MATADLITAFLSNEMSPEAERQFLVSVAASDALRLELKSHLMVDRILGERVQRAHVPDGVRAAIFAQAGISTVMAASADAAPHTAEPAPTPAVDRAPAPRGSFFSRFAGRVTIVAAAAALFSSGYYVGSEKEAPVVAARPSAPASAIDRAADPRTLDAPTTSLAEETPAIAAPRETPSAASSVRTAPQRRGERVDGQTSAANPPAVVDAQQPATTATPARPNIRRPRTNVPVGVDGSIRQPTEEERTRESNPIDPNGGK